LVNHEDPAAYGDTFADVYDDWYANVTDVASTVDTLVRLSGGGSLLELGVGTGRIALPLARRLGGSARVVGVDASPDMMNRFRAKLASEPDHVSSRVEPRLGDMKDAVPGRLFSVIFCTFNTFFNLPSAAAQRECLRNAVSNLAPGGAVVLETAVFPDLAEPGERTETRTRPDGTEVHSTSRILDDSNGERIAEGLFSDDQGRSWPWRICFASPRQIDDMARDAADLVCTDRWENFGRQPFVSSSSRQVCVLRRRL
jgi:SAM-dependent methyltransferase